MHIISSSQCFPRFYYEKISESAGTLFKTGKTVDGYIRHDCVTDIILNRARALYKEKINKLSKSQIFYYVYGLFHSPVYRETFFAELKKMLPRLQLPKDPEVFLAFSEAGNALARLHLKYEAVPPYGGVQVTGDGAGDFKVEKMRFAKGSDRKEDKSVILYSSKIRISGIPLEAYRYVVNGQSAIEWVMERYQDKIDKGTRLRNDANAWALEHDQPRYILDLLLRMITVSLETMRIVDGLPVLGF
jgi:predicted helicase